MKRCYKLFFAETLVMFLISQAVISEGSPTFSKHQNARIVGGEPLLPNEFPFITPLYYLKRLRCGGIIISQDYLLTAAQCVYYGFPGQDEFEIRAGEHSLSSVTGTEQVRYFSEILVNPDFDAWLLSNDIAIVKLNNSLTYNNAVQPLALPPQGHVAKGNCFVAGWGATSEGGELQDIPSKVMVQIVSAQECRAAYGEDEMTDDMLCAGWPEGGRDACQGDSGNGLICTDLGYPYLAGLVSWGRSCGLVGYPGVYADVSLFRDWIKNEVNI